MHELAIAQGILTIAEREAGKMDSVFVEKIKVRLGEFTGIVKEALEFSFDVVKQGTVAEHADLAIEVVKLRKSCSKCASIFLSPGDYSFLCPVCNSPVEIVAGRELQVEYVDLRTHRSMHA
jgi:hydrogenase nickel incorporation protein HypA/HybF